MKAKSLQVGSADELRSALSGFREEDFRPRLAIVFMPNEKGIEQICGCLSENGIRVFGASSFGQFVGPEYEKTSIVIMLIEIPAETFIIEFRESGKENMHDIAREIGEAGKAAFRHPAFIVVSGGIESNGEAIVEGILETAGKSVPLFGGLAACPFTEKSTYAFTNDIITQNGLVALILDNEKISVNGWASGGSQPLGMFHTITRSEGNVVYTIDDQPALDILLRYSGKEADIFKGASNILGDASAFQVELHRENRSPIMRTPMQANPENRSVTFAGTIPQHSKVKFCILPGFEVVRNVISEFSEFKKRTADADALILFSCMGREIAFGPWMNEEIGSLLELWKAPLIGFFTFGEIGRTAANTTEFFNVTSSLTVLKEIN